MESFDRAGAIGGHDHMALPSEEPRLFKADADAVTAWVVELSKCADSSIEIDAWQG